MGSAGTGRLTDYSQAGATAGGGGGASGEDKCAEPIQEQLEEVARCQYYQDHKTVPPSGTPLTVVISNRVGVETEQLELVGYLPTRYNYIASCIRSGYRYSGVIEASTDVHVPAVLIRLTPVKVR